MHPGAACTIYEFSSVGALECCPLLLSSCQFPSITHPQSISLKLSSGATCSSHVVQYTAPLCWLADYTLLHGALFMSPTRQKVIWGSCPHIIPVNIGVSILDSRSCLPRIGPLFTLLRKWICVVGKVGYDDTGRFSFIKGIEGLEELAAIFRRILEGFQYLLGVGTKLRFTILSLYTFTKKKTQCNNYYHYTYYQ
jgi:hypothetical protein